MKWRLSQRYSHEGAFLDEPLKTKNVNSGSKYYDELHPSRFEDNGDVRMIV